ncbi:SHOCT domain-containing protein [Sphingomonas sp.]|nr:SHOCT domain-containing protein [Sphingomonas sp.]
MAEMTDIVVDQIRKLAELRDSGVLTEEEFAAKKAELLDRL